MPNPRFNSMITQHCAEFRQLFGDLVDELFQRQDGDSRSGKLTHPGKYGSHREVVAHQFLAPFTPSQLATGSGFVINAEAKESGECDIVVFDTDLVPFASRLELGLFYPAESVCCVGEVKSTLKTESELKSALKQLAKIVERCTRESNLKSGLLAFLICKKIGDTGKTRPVKVETLLPNCVRSVIAETSGKFVPQLVLSVDDGLLEFVENDDPNKLKFTYISPGKNSTTHLKKFLSRYYTHTMTRRRRELRIFDYCQESLEDLEFPG